MLTTTTVKKLQLQMFIVYKKTFSYFLQDIIMTVSCGKVYYAECGTRNAECGISKTCNLRNCFCGKKLAELGVL